MLTKTDFSHQAGALVVMLKESDLLSHTVIEAEAFGCFCQQMERSDWAGLCSERIGGGGHCLGSAGSKVKCCHGSIELRIEKAEACRMGFWGLGNQCNGVEGSCLDSLNICFLLKSKCIYNCAC